VPRKREISAYACQHFHTNQGRGARFLVCTSQRGQRRKLKSTIKTELLSITIVPGHMNWSESLITEYSVMMMENLPFLQ
jgi:hypothetical protein